ncbi:RNA polymerase sigma factor [Psychroserpens algicola]|uniref:Sigma-70 family RNA polymerase sigma factor n=1 Tax=Psychroserpens algicola TaxID=1719034 RepID=A0ABT0H889_9FLAO|nr:sigma-70 family RNA polymerase sigma factor [Psychroserpens algicola]MCK8480566.1 sigma-70 family RNA polymerase sigma factor [Psychroserpens algicola]
MGLEQLIKACKKHNLKAQSQLYQMYKDDLFTLCLKYCRNKEEAQDNLQDAFLEIFGKIKTYKGVGSFEGWIKRITINKAIDKYKKDSHLNIVINNDILEDQSLMDMEALEHIPLDLILKHIQDLPPQYRLVFNLYELDGYSHKEISKLLNISISTSKSNLHRAKTILQTKMQNSTRVSPKNLTSNGY